MGALLSICCIFSEYLFLITPLDGCFCWYWLQSLFLMIISFFWFTIYLIKIWSKRKFCKISKLPILGRGQDRKRGNFVNLHFQSYSFLSLVILNFGSWVSCTTKNLSKRKLSEIYEFSILGMKAKLITRKPLTFSLFLFKLYCNL